MDDTSLDAGAQRCWARAWLDSEHPIVAAAVASLQPGDSPRLTAESKAEAQQMTEAVDVPPIIVHQSTMKVVDGGRRVRAAQRRHQDTITVWFFDGTAEEAFILAVAANTGHGLPLCTKDCKAAAARILEMYPGWSDRRVAAETGISHHTVAAVRRECSTGQTAQLNTRLGKDGNNRPTNATERRNAAAELIRADQGTSVREVSRRSGVSLGTAHKIKTEIAKGVNLAAAKARAVNLPYALARGQVVLKRMWHDPALRGNEERKTVLELLSCALDITHEAQVRSRTLPEHTHGPLVEVALAMADSWTRFAQDLRGHAQTI